MRSRGGADAEECISYQIPAFKLHGSVLLYFAGWQEHYSVYPASDAMVAAFPASWMCTRQQGHAALFADGKGADGVDLTHREVSCEGDRRAQEGKGGGEEVLG